MHQEMGYEMKVIGAGATARNVLESFDVLLSFTLPLPRQRTLAGESPSELWHSTIPGVNELASALIALLDSDATAARL